MMIIKWLAAIVIAFIVGKLISKLRLPSILGWLITGIAVGPYAFCLCQMSCWIFPHTKRSFMFWNARWDL